MINVTKVALPDREKYKQYVDTIFENGWVTNNGPLVRQLEEKLENYLGVKHVVLVSNGTAALEVAYRTLELKGEVITTPFSFVATTSSLVSSGLTPVFADINPDTLNLDSNNIEKLINKNTSAIVPVHVFGNGCEVEKIDEIAKKYNLKVVYDAAHAFGVKYKLSSILNFGDISTLSFHATKLFHTIEGGALIVNDDSLVEKARRIINFGIESEESIPEVGQNAKMNEFEAAMGLCMLEDIDDILKDRKDIYTNYIVGLDSKVIIPEQNKNSAPNYSYFPVIFKNEEELKKIRFALNKENIFPRRYFYPSLDTLNYIKSKQYCKNSRDISKRILCLPMYPDLSISDQNRIIGIISRFIKTT